jgi:hypothetical protein
MVGHGGLDDDLDLDQDGTAIFQPCSITADALAPIPQQAP